jgi:hypothetical protein
MKKSSPLRWASGLGALGCCFAALGAEPVSSPWRLGKALDLPSWLKLGGEYRMRYETLDGQFRAGRTGGDQALTFRTSLAAELRTEPVQLVTEVLDARQYLSDAGSPLDTTMVNALDVLQAHLRWQAGDLIPGGTNTVRIGRETLDLGNRRLVARNAFRNTINSFTGVDWLWEAQGGGSVRAFYFLPVQRLPSDFASLLDNEIVADTQGFGQQFWGLYGTLPTWGPGIRSEVYWLQLLEDADADSRRRRLHTPGLRVFRNPAAGEWDFELEAAYQVGDTRVRAGLNEPVLDHEAHLLHAGVGHTFDLIWKPRIGVRYTEATGDNSPNDGSNERFDTLFGARRWEFGPTGIYGLVPRANLRSPDWQIAVRPRSNLELSATHRLIWLESARDAWTAAGVRDATGSSGDFVGHQVETRLRYDALPGNLRIDTGVVYFAAGGFAEAAPNATRQGDSVFSYVELTLTF